MFVTAVGMDTEFFEICIHFGAVKVVHSKSSDKHEIDDKFLKLNFLV